jgi:DNA-binding LytR/AlgR family response regulator
MHNYLGGADNMLQVAIVEDEENYRQQIRNYIQQFAVAYKKKIEIVEFTDGKEIMDNYMMNYDIILLDIEMPMQNGMETAKRIRDIDQDVIIIFITNMSQYAVNGYEVDALDFILKPINYDAFSIRFHRAINRIKKKENGRVVLNMDNGIKTLGTGQIYYIESQNRFLIYHTTEGDYSVRGTMKSVEEELARYNFVQCNHWFLVNLQHVSEINNGVVYVDGNELEISRRKHKTFLEAFTRYMGGSI